MANINQIQVGSTVYDIEDQTARNDISNLADVASSGDYEDLSNTPTGLSEFTDDLGNSPTHTHSQYATLDSDSKVTANQASSSIVTVTADYTLALTDAGKFHNVASNNAVIITIPANSSVAFPIGTEMEFCRNGAGTVTFAAASGVTVSSIDSQKSISDIFGCAALKKLAADTWILSGSLG